MKDVEVDQVFQEVVRSTKPEVSRNSIQLFLLSFYKHMILLFFKD